MKMNKKLFCIILAAIMLVLTVAGCKTEEDLVEKSWTGVDANGQRFTLTESYGFSLTIKQAEGSALEGLNGNKVTGRIVVDSNANNVVQGTVANMKISNSDLQEVVSGFNNSPIVLAFSAEPAPGTTVTISSTNPTIHSFFGGTIDTESSTSTSAIYTIE